jgi:hypothetical protein
MLKTLATSNWDESFSHIIQQDAIKSLEGGQILHFPGLPFNLLREETYFLSPDHADPHTKNISYQPECGKLWGVQRLNDEQRLQLKEMLDRFSRYALCLVQALFPLYSKQLVIARTSFRPVEISGRKTSYRKDDKRIHVDAFPSAPNQGKRILRVFCNINPHQKDRVWRVGEAFDKVATRFLPKIQRPFPGSLRALRLLRITKSYRTLYDHYMLHIHDLMKASDEYQKTVEQQEICFPTGTSWIVQTDHVSHAAMIGQYVLEQTFYLPVSSMQNESLSPLRVLENTLKMRLV